MHYAYTLILILFFSSYGCTLDPSSPTERTNNPSVPPLPPPPSPADGGQELVGSSTLLFCTRRVSMSVFIQSTHHATADHRIHYPGFTLQPAVTDEDHSQAVWPQCLGNQTGLRAEPSQFTVTSSYPILLIYPRTDLLISCCDFLPIATT